MSFSQPGYVLEAGQEINLWTHSHLSYCWLFCKRQQVSGLPYIFGIVEEAISWGLWRTILWSWEAVIQVEARWGQLSGVCHVVTRWYRLQGFSQSKKNLARTQKYIHYILSLAPQQTANFAYGGLVWRPLGCNTWMAQVHQSRRLPSMMPVCFNRKDGLGLSSSVFSRSFQKCQKTTFVGPWISPIFWTPNCLQATLNSQTQKHVHFHYA